MSWAELHHKPFDPSEYWDGLPKRPVPNPAWEDAVYEVLSWGLVPINVGPPPKTMTNEVVHYELPLYQAPKVVPIIHKIEVPSLSGTDKMCFGKHNGKQLQELPMLYRKWLRGELEKKYDGKDYSQVSPIERSQYRLYMWLKSNC